MAPQIASFPRSPPGKKRGSIVCPSVLRITSLFPIFMEAPSSRASREIPSRACLFLNFFKNKVTYSKVTKMFLLFSGENNLLNISSNYSGYEKEEKI